MPCCTSYRTVLHLERWVNWVTELGGSLLKCCVLMLRGVTEERHEIYV
jgi:hypothetical protein